MEKEYNLHDHNSSPPLRMGSSCDLNKKQKVSNMVTTCRHFSNPFNDNPFGENKEPTNEQINKYRLYKCSECNRWYSFMGITRGE